MDGYSKNSVKRFLQDIKTTIKSNKMAETENLIRILNPKIIGWGNYYRHCAASKVFSKMDASIFAMLWRWIQSRHTRKSARWRKKRYFRNEGLENWIFSAKTVNKKTGKVEYIDKVNMSKIHIRRHIKIKADANPFDPTFTEYFKNRKYRKEGSKTFISNMQTLPTT